MAFAPSKNIVNLPSINARSALVLGFVTQLLVACGGSSSSPNPMDAGGTVVPLSERRVISNDQAYAYKPDSKYADVLTDCIVIRDEPCTLVTLPFIGLDHPNPTVANIMDRVIVTHDWMGSRFEQMLNVMPPETLKLYVPITAIIIGSEVDGTSYWSTPGRIKIDPELIWLSNTEKLTIRNELAIAARMTDTPLNSDAVKYDTRWLMAKNGDYAWESYSLSGSEERTVRDILLPTALDLFHSLGHANDDIRPMIFPSLLASDTPKTAADKVDDGNNIRDLLYDESLALSDNDSWLFGVSRTLYDEDVIPDAVIDFTAEDAGAIMATEGKQTLYGYVTSNEDVATLFSHSMMRRFYDVETHVLIFNRPADRANATCDDYIVGWGSTNRAAADLVQIRSKFVMEQVMGESAQIDNFYANIGSEGQIPVGEGYCQTLDALLVGAEEPIEDTIDTVEFERDSFGTH